ncbi:hypothetical protein MPNT_390012 [Candidatus Methylacidithermus pantelleriae]|uniref:Uncharacterized protein n=1 Tax=Candidatus Methylacidithermus pantelleriae TaxID=2744239 RepID=A0A8J2BP83_9BACT|nr:hypothetical protein MPNT_390012 [Candidatus Methylacidithermus pantelleriae]
MMLLGRKMGAVPLWLVRSNPRRRLLEGERHFLHGVEPIACIMTLRMDNDGQKNHRSRSRGCTAFPD